MGEHTEISWCDHTFNPWMGCTKVSDGCKHCYAETYGNRFGVEWGPSGLRKRTSDSNWAKPLAWNRAARREGVRRRVFCASLADVFEENPQVDSWRMDLFDLIEQTTNLEWLLLTKRPENVISMIPLAWSSIPDHVWIGTTVENQAMADKRIPELLRIPTRVRFLSCEPLLGTVSLDEWFIGYIMPEIHWVIVGGESGTKARPMHRGWARSLRDQCKAAGVPFFFKQWGEFHPVIFDTGDGDIGVLPSAQTDPDVKPKLVAFDGEMERIGKRAAGHLLDGQIVQEFPAAKSH